MKDFNRKGIFLLEGVIVLGIFAIFISISLPMIKNSILIKSIIKSEIAYNRNFTSVMNSISREIKNYSELNIEDRGNQLTIINNIYKEGKYIQNKVRYYFVSDRTLRRKEIIDNISKKEESILEDVKGNFFEEDGFIKLKIKYKNKEEEYVYR